MSPAEREDHEHAARAAGLQLVWKEGTCKGGAFCAPFLAGTETPWRPREDDGDALRLAVACGRYSLNLMHCLDMFGRANEYHADPVRAVRLSIFRAAVARAKVPLL
jgi:hypothetical protein